MNLYNFYTTFFVVFSTLLGITIGSFLNVVIYRLPVGKTISKGHSMCMSCGHTLGAADLVPLFSWLSLKGKCRYCKAPVPSRYAKIESLTGLIFLIASFTHREVGLILSGIFNPIMIMLTAYFVLFVIASASTIASMMIYFDTQKAFAGPALFSVISSTIACFILASYDGYNFFDLQRILIFIIYVASFLAIIWLFFQIFSKKYTKNDLFLDMTLAGIISFSYYLWLDSNIITASAYLTVFGLIHAILKDTKYDRYIGIIGSSVIAILLIIRYFI